jgi:hypothetical protein
VKLTTYHTRHPFDKRAGFSHAHKDTSPVLKERSSWRTINGVFFNVGNLSLLFEFRRVYKSPKGAR